MALMFDGDYIVGGPPETRLSPNFKLKELTRKNGTVRVHRELVSALQIVRDRYAESITVDAMSSAEGQMRGEPGLFAWLTSSDTDRLGAVARGLKDAGFLARAQRRESRVFVGVGDPNALPAVDAIDAIETAVQVSAGYETSGDPYQQVTGNFDGAGMSFGPSQVNFGTGTLAPVFAKLKAADEASYRACFDNAAHYDEWLRILDAPRAEQIAWADSRSTGAKKGGFAKPWKTYLQAVGRVPLFRAIVTEHSVQEYGKKLKRARKWLTDNVGIKIDHLRTTCALYDLVTQQGSLDKAHTQILRRVELDRPDDQFELMRIAVEERGKKANMQWRADAVSRRLGILNRQRTPTSIDGHSANRDNRRFYLLRNVSVRGLDSLG